MSEEKVTEEVLEKPPSVDEVIAKMDDSLEDVLKFLKEKHEEFESRFSVLKRAREKGFRASDIDPLRVLEVAATYPSLGHLCLIEYEAAKTRYEAMKEAYEAWYVPCKNYAEGQMKAAKEHVTLKSIEQKVALLWPQDYGKWKDELLKASLNKDLLERRMQIVHDSRYTFQTTSGLRDMWQDSYNVSKGGHRGMSIDDPQDLEKAVAESDRVNNNEGETAVPPPPPPPQ